MKPSAPVSRRRTNRPERVTPEMRPVELGADLAGEELRQQPVGRLALGQHGAPLGGRDVLGDAGQLAASASRQPILAEAERRDQGAVDDQVGIAADRRGEVGVAVEVEAEMAVVLGRVFGLRLASAAPSRETCSILPALRALARMRLKSLGADRLGLGEGQVERAEELAQRRAAFRGSACRGRGRAAASACAFPAFRRPRRWRRSSSPRSAGARRAARARGRRRPCPCRRG